MDVTKKIFNVLGIIVAWILSIALVIMLMVTPTILSALELLDVNTLVDTVTDVLVEQVAPSKETVATYEVTKLANESGAVNDAAQSGEDVLTSIFGDQVSAEVMEKILSSNAAKQFIAAYADGFANALTGKGNTQIDAALVKKIINDNLDEVIELVKLASPSAANMSIEELKKQIADSVDKTAEKITKTIPQPEQIKEAVLEENPELETILLVIAQKDAIKAAYVGTIAFICVLIFLCRLPGYRGFRWLATDLFVGGGFCALQSVGLFMAMPLVKEMANEPAVAGLVAGLLKRFTTGVAVRTGVMLVIGAGLLVAYIFIKKALDKKAAPAEKYDIIVLAGQSNAEGQGRGDVTEEYVPDERIHFMKDAFNAHFVTTDGVSVLHYDWPAPTSVSVADERIKDDVKMGCFALQFAQKYAAECLEDGRKVLIVNANFGGTGFHRPEWGVGNIMHERMVAMTNEALGYNPGENKVVAVLWSQGEHDAFEDADWDAEKRYLTHKENLTATFADFYERTGCKDAPIIACGFTDTYCQSVPEASAAVLKAIVECIADVDGGFVDTKGLQSNSQANGGEDIYHYCREALHILGGKLFEKYLEIKK